MKHLPELTEKYRLIAEYIKDAQSGQVLTLNALSNMNKSWDKKEVHQWIKAPLSSLGNGMYRKLAEADLDFIKALESLSLADSTTELPEPKASMPKQAANSVRFHALPSPMPESTTTPMHFQVLQPLQEQKGFNPEYFGQKLKFYSEDSPNNPPKKRKATAEKENYTQSY